MSVTTLKTRLCLAALATMFALATVPAPAAATDNHDDGDGQNCNGLPNDLYVSSHQYYVGGVGSASPPGNMPPATALTVQFSVSPCGEVPGQIKLSLVSYDATTDLNLDDQTVHDSDSVTTGQGYQYSLTVSIPTCSYQIDFVYGDVIADFNPETYHGENRYISGSSQSRECVPKHETNTTTIPSAKSINLGDTVSDTAFVVPASPDVNGPVTGSVEFFICSPDTVPCVSGGYDMGAFELVNGQINTGEIRPGLPGDYCFRAEYLGNEAWLPSQDASITECVNVMAPTNTTTTPSQISIDPGQAINDTAVVTSTNPDVAGPVTGAVQFYLCAVDVVPCTTGGTAVGGPVALVNGQATSPDVDAAPGTYCFRGEYLGAVGWAPSQDSGVNECFTVEREPTRTVTTPSVTEANVGDSVTDHAHVSAVEAVGDTNGVVKFFVCDVNVVPCTTGGTVLGTVALDVNGNATSPAFVPTEPGTYCFRGEFGGNDEYAPSTDASESECFIVKAQVPFFPSTGALLLGLVGSLGAVVLMLRKKRS